MSDQNDTRAADTHQWVKCARPTCPKKAARHHRGLCKAHYDADRLAHRKVDAAIVTAHLARLRAAGLGWVRIAQLSDTSIRTVTEVGNGRRAWCQNPSATRILAVPVPTTWWRTAAPKCLGDATGTIRRARALTAIGYGNQRLADEVGTVHEHVSAIVLGKSDKVTADLARRYAAAYDRLQLTPAPPSRETSLALSRSVRNGYAPPLAWDEDTIDDPAATADGWQKVLPIRPRSRIPFDFAEIVADHRALGHDDTRIAAACGITLDGLWKRYEKLGIERRVVVDVAQGIAS